MTDIQAIEHALRMIEAERSALHAGVLAIARRQPHLDQTQFAAGLDDLLTDCFFGAVHPLQEELGWAQGAGK
jgi:hypothetical protein